MSSSSGYIAGVPSAHTTGLTSARGLVTIVSQLDLATLLSYRDILAGRQDAKELKREHLMVVAQIRKCAQQFCGDWTLIDVNEEENIELVARMLVTDNLPLKRDFLTTVTVDSVDGDLGELAAVGVIWLNVAKVALFLLTAGMDKSGYRSMMESQAYIDQIDSLVEAIYIAFEIYSLSGNERDKVADNSMNSDAPLRPAGRWYDKLRIMLVGHSFACRCARAAKKQSKSTYRDARKTLDDAFAVLQPTLEVRNQRKFLRKRVTGNAEDDYNTLLTSYPPEEVFREILLFIDRVAKEVDEIETSVRSRLQNNCDVLILSETHVNVVPGTSDSGQSMADAQPRSQEWGGPHTSPVRITDTDGSSGAKAASSPAANRRASTSQPGVATVRKRKNPDADTTSVRPKTKAATAQSTPNVVPPPLGTVTTKKSTGSYGILRRKNEGVENAPNDSA